MSAANTSESRVHQHVEQIAQLEVLERGLRHLLELPDRGGHGLGLRARRPLGLGASLLRHIHELPDVALWAVVAVRGQGDAHDRVHDLAVLAHEALLRLGEQRAVAQQPAHDFALVLAVRGVRQLPERPFQQLRRRSPEQLA